MHFMDIGRETMGLVQGIENAVTKMDAKTSKSLDNIQTSSQQLSETLTEAIRKTNIVVEQLEAIPPKLDAQLKKIEMLELGVETTKTHVGEAKNGIDHVINNTEPKKARKEAFKLMWHSVAWGTIASTLCGVGAGALIGHFTSKNAPLQPEPTKIETRIIEKEACLQTPMILRDKTKKIVYTLEMASAQEQLVETEQTTSPKNSKTQSKKAPKQALPQ